MMIKIHHVVTAVAIGTALCSCSGEQTQYSAAPVAENSNYPLENFSLPTNDANDAAALGSQLDADAAEPAYGSPGDDDNVVINTGTGSPKGR